MLRTHTCGELRLSNINETITLTGWVQKSRDLGGMTFVDLRDRYGITQLAFNMDTNADLCTRARKLGREFVLKVTGTVKERESKNLNMPTQYHYLSRRTVYLPYSFHCILVQNHIHQGRIYRKKGRREPPS